MNKKEKFAGYSNLSIKLFFQSWPSENTKFKLFNLLNL